VVCDNFSAQHEQQVRDWCADHDAGLVVTPGQRVVVELDRVRVHRVRSCRIRPLRSGVVLGCAQEKAGLFRTEKRRGVDGRAYPWIVLVLVWKSFDLSCALAHGVKVRKRKMARYMPPDMRQRRDHHRSRREHVRSRTASSGPRNTSDRRLEYEAVGLLVTVATVRILSVVVFYRCTPTAAVNQSRSRRGVAPTGVRQRRQLPAARWVLGGFAWWMP